jgi:hypothetical protein
MRTLLVVLEQTRGEATGRPGDRLHWPATLPQLCLNCYLMAYTAT